jgi:HSP20 family protein
MRSIYLSDSFLTTILEDVFQTPYTKYTKKDNEDIITETTDSFDIEIDIPGVNKEDINISIESEHLKITAQRKRADSVVSEYTKQYKLSPIINKDDITAKYENGVLTVKVGKKAKEKARKVSVT